MEKHDRLSAAVFCTHHHIELSFLQLLHEQGLIELHRQNEEAFLQPDEVGVVEKLVRLHYDLQINVEGLDAIGHLLQRLEALQTEVAGLKNRVRFYEQQLGA